MISIIVTLWCLVAGFVTWVMPFTGYVMLLPVYGWIFFGNGVKTMKGGWPATFMMEDVESTRGVKVLFAVMFALQSLYVLVPWILRLAADAGRSE